MGFRLRLASFFVATLAIIQALTAFLVYEVTRRQLITEGERQLSAEAGNFVRQLDDISQRVADSVHVLALDYALRSAIAQHDRGTVLSALRNHGRRIGAARMLLVELDRTVEADVGGALEGRPFPFPALIDKALSQPSAAVVALGDGAYWVIVVPVLAPVPIGFIAAGIPIDNLLLSRMQRTSTLPKAIELASAGGAGQWQVLAQGVGQVPLTRHLLAQGGFSDKATMIDVDGREYLVRAVRLDQTSSGAPVAAVLGYSLDEALASYRPVAITWAALLALGLGIGLAGAMVIARGVSRPVEALAATARKIEAGDYRPPQPLARHDEIGQLSAAFANMAQAIGEREDRIRFQSTHDLATGLLNRLAAETGIEDALVGQGNGALLVVGLVRLPEIVKTMGHAVADRLIRYAADSVRQLAGQGSVARIGDASLSVWLSAAAQADATRMAAALVERLREPYREADLAIDMSPAVGIALGPQHGAAASKLMQRAEVALLAATGTHDRVAVYDPVTDPHRPERLSLMGDLLQGIERGQLRLHYQPKVNLDTRRIDAAEGLVRWNHPVRGRVPPDAFIGLAEETGNIRRLTQWAMAAGAAQERDWEARGWEMKLAVNVSARDLADVDLPQRMDDLLAEHGLASHRMMLEITESAVMDEPDAAIQVLRNLADRGIDLAIDDFGVGQSSLAYLRRLPVRELKIDQTFVRKLAVDREDQTIVRSIVELGHRLGYRVTAEGVEDEGAFEYLTTIGCDHAQGYFIARPLAPADFDQFVGAARWSVQTAEAA